MNKERNYSFDLLRSLSMLLIILGHAIYHGLRHIYSPEVYDLGIRLGDTTSMVNYGATQILGYMAEVGVNVFVLITGYFTIKAKPLREVADKAVGLTLRTWCFSLLLFGVALVFGVAKADGESIVHALAPVHSNSYWFITAYLAMLLVSPFVVRLTSGLERRQYTILLAILTVLNVAQGEVGFGRIFGGSMTLVWFIYLFILGGYIRRFDPWQRWLRHPLATYLALCGGMSVVSVALQCWQAAHVPEHIITIRSLANNSLTLLTSVCLFVYFKRLQIGKAGRVASAISPYIFGIYLLHDNYFLRQWEWEQLLPSGIISLWWCVPYLLGLTVAIFAVGLLIDRVLMFPVANALHRLVRRLLPRKWRA